MGQVRQRLHAKWRQLEDASRAWLAHASLFGSLIRKSPHVLVVPVVLFCLMTTLGIWGVKTAVKSTQEMERNKAAMDADSASQALQLAIQRASLPLTQLAEIVKLMPQMSLLEKQWAVSAPAVWLGAPRGSLFLAATPLGVNRLFYPTNLTKPFSVALMNGVNAFYPPLREVAMDVLRTQGPTLQGPALANDQYLITMITHSVYFANVSQNDTWDYKFNERLCPPGLCYNNETRTRWWGMLSLALDAGYLFGPEGELSSLTRKGYQFQLWYPPADLGVANALVVITGDTRGISGTVRVTEAKVAVRGLVPISDLTSKTSEPDDPVVALLPVVNHMWELHVWKDSWAPSWMLPLIAVVVLGALLVSVLVFTTLWSWAENRALLHSLLPKETIERMRHEGKWATDKGDDAIKTVRLETPAELMLRIIEDCIAGRNPGFPLLLSVRDALHRSADVYRPNEQQMRSRMNQLANMDDDVRKALTAQLMGGAQSYLHRGPHTHVLDDDDDDDDDAADTSASHVKAGLKSPSALLPGKVLDSAGLLKSATDSIHLGSVSVDHYPVQMKPAERPAAAAIKLTSSGRHSQTTRDVTFNKKWCTSEVQSVLASWLLQTEAVSSIVQPQSKQAPAPATLDTSALIRAEPADDNQTDASVEPVSVVMRPILTQLEQVLNTASLWTFDAFALEEASHGRPLSCLGFWLLHSSGVKTWARIKTSRLICFLERVEAGYADNPYHNKRHAADVLQSVHVIMHRSGLMPGFADQLTLLGCYLAAIVHDFEHVGRNNDFLINSSDDLAVRYNDRSPMENHHLAAAWSLLKTKECNILSGLSSSDVAKLRKLVIDLVLGTDMKQHFAIQGQFETMASQAHERAFSVRNSGSTKHSGHARTTADGGPEPELTPVNDQDQLLSLQMMLKCADLGHIAAPLPVHLKWVSALEAEFFLQGDAEKAMGIPISPLCDRTKEGVTKSQIGFFDFVVLPGCKTFCSRFTGAAPLLAAVLSNQAYWKSLAAGST